MWRGAIRGLILLRKNSVHVSLKDITFYSFICIILIDYFNHRYLFSTSSLFTDLFSFPPSAGSLSYTDVLMTTVV